MKSNRIAFAKLRASHNFNITSQLCNFVWNTSSICRFLDAGWFVVLPVSYIRVAVPY
jgi:hypothetical protein